MRCGRRNPSVPGGTLRGVGGAPRVRAIGLASNALVTPLSVKASYDPFWGKSESLHHEGIFVQSRRLLPMGTQALLDIHLQLPAIKLVIEAEVVHCVVNLGLGMAFLDPPRATRDALSRLIAFGQGAPFELRR